MMRKAMLIFCMTILSFIMTNNSFCAPIRYDFGGTLSVDLDYSLPDAAPLQDIQSDMSFQGSFIYDSSSVLSLGADGEYYGGFYNFEISFANVSLTSPTSIFTTVHNDLLIGSQADILQAYFMEPTATIEGFGVKYWEDFTFGFFDPTATALDATILPDDLLPDDFDEISWNVAMRGLSNEICGYLNGNVTWMNYSPVPEPSTMLFCLLGISAGFFKIRKKSSSDI